MDTVCKTISRLLAALLALLCLAGCSKSAKRDTPVSASVIPLPEDLPVLTYPLITSGDTPASLVEMERQFNIYCAEKIGATIRFVTVDVNTLENYYLLRQFGEEAVDFIALMPAVTQLADMVDAGLVMPLDGLLEEHGQGVAAAAAEVLPVGQIGGIQYMIPAVKDVYTMGTSIEFNAALVKKYGFDIHAVQTITDLEPMLAVIAANEPGVIPLTAYGDTTGFTQLLSGYDSLGDTLGVLNLAEDDSLTVVDWYETDRFLELARLMRDWNEKGYIDRDAAVRQVSGTLQVRSGGAFCSIGTITPVGGDLGTNLDSASGMAEVQLADQSQMYNSYNVALEGICISSSCREPEKAIALLDLLYTDPYAANLIVSGVEGTDYVFNEDGLADDGGSVFLLFGQPINQSLRYMSTGIGTEYETRCAAFTANDTVSPAFGFVFDSSPVAREMALCRTVVKQYYPLIDCGCVNPDTEIPKFVTALKDAGIETVVAEKQRQLDAWSRTMSRHFLIAANDIDAGVVFPVSPDEVLS